MNAPQTLNRSPFEIAQKLAEQFAETAAERDKTGGNPKYERDLIRQSGLLGLSIPAQYGGQGADWKTIFQTTCMTAHYTNAFCPQIFD